MSDYAEAILLVKPEIWRGHSYFLGISGVENSNMEVTGNIVISCPNYAVFHPDIPETDIRLFTILKKGQVHPIK